MSLPGEDDPRGAAASAERLELQEWEGKRIPDWESEWGVPRLEVWVRLGSTNDRLRELARAGAAPFTTVLAEEQTAGRGRGGRPWDSPPGLGLWMSVLLRPPAAEAARLAPLLVGLAVCRACEAAAGVPAALKWPNDVWLEARKVAGILCEGAGGAVVVGVGLNVRQRLRDFPEELRGRAVSLEMAAGAPVGRAPLAGRVIEEVRRLLARPPLRLEAAVSEELARRDALRGRRIAVEGGASGVARGIDARGRLLVETAPGHVQAVASGSVTVEALPERETPSTGS